MDDLVKRICCPICFSKNTLKINQIDINNDVKLELFVLRTYNNELLNYLKKKNYEYKILMCKECNTYYQESLMPESMTHLFYNKGRSTFKSFSKALESSSKYTRNLTNAKNYKKKTLSEILNLLKSHKKKLGKTIRAIEFGSGWGFFALALKQNNIDVESIEMSEIRRNFQEEILGLKVFNSLDKLKKKKYDIITSFQVIEHLNYPIQMLENLYGKLSEGGVMRIEVPTTLGIKKNIDKDFYRFVGKSSLQPLEHLQAFTNDTFKKIAEKLDCKYIFQPIPTNIYNRIKQKNFRSIFNKKESIGRVTFVKRSRTFN
tara:strand:- start:6669 stop:7616 length:948 start_codon:yes stop_codon:yes gene_type:complete